MDWTLLILALLSALSVMTVYIPRPAPSFNLSWIVLLVSMPTIELAWLWLPVQVAVALVLCWAGALESSLGQLALFVLFLSWAGLGLCVLRSFQTGQVVEQALASGLGIDYRERVANERRLSMDDDVQFSDCLSPFNMNAAGVERIDDIQYAGSGPRRRLDIYRPKNIPAEGCPVLLQIHGGALMMGHKRQQARPLMNYMAERGWICVAPNYRLSPSVGFPTHLEDVRSALGWIRTHGEEYGMDTRFVAVTGGSAGGQLAALIGLTSDLGELHSEYPGADLSVQACVPIYGAYDFHHHGESDPHLRERFEGSRDFVQDFIMHYSAEEKPELWDLGSAILHVQADAPPFMVIHGDRDSLLATGDARTFSKALAEVSNNKVVYVELPGTEHGFDPLHSPRTEYVIRGIYRFLEWARAQKQSLECQT